MWVAVTLLLFVHLLGSSVTAQVVNDTNGTYVVEKGITKCKSRDIEIDNNGTADMQTAICPMAPQLRYLVDDGAGASINTYVFSACGFILWMIGWGFISKYTVDSGYVDIPRTIESSTANQRRAASLCIVFIELPQLLAICFNSAMKNEYSPDMSRLRDVLLYWLLRFDDSFQSGMFALIIVVTWFLIIVIYVPLAVAILSPEWYARYASKISPTTVWVTEWSRDVYLYYLPLPIFVNLLKPFFCTDYAPPPAGFGEKSTASWDNNVVCWEGNHIAMLVVGGITLFVYYLSCLAAGMVPVLVAKATDLVTNGRYTAISIQCKLWIAGVFCLCETKYRWAHVSTVFAGLSTLTLFSITMRPCRVERINFYKSSCLAVAVWVCITNMFVAALDDPSALSPFRMAYGGSVVLLVVISCRYYLIPDSRIFPPILVEDGTYEGAVSLATLLRHGYGTQRWSDGAEYVGSFFFGRITGRGVLRLANQMYYEGQWSNGKRHGFGKTNMINSADVKEYEGYFQNDEFEGFGKKTFLDCETYEGEWKKGQEHGIGIWKFPDGSTVYGDWDEGEIKLPDKRHEIDKASLQGTMRYGVLHGSGARSYEDGGKYDGQFSCGVRHGEGRMLWSDSSTYHGGWNNDRQHGDGHFESPDGTSYEGDWLNGKMDGFGILLSSTGETFEGNFKSGERKGYGKCTYNDSNKFIEYTGSWSNGTHTGKGTMLYQNGDKYEGPWLHGLRNGNPGVYIFADGSWYEGDWAYDDEDGEGILYLTDVGQYTGSFNKSMRDGQGRFEWLDGSLYQGQWQSNTMHGHGVLNFRSDILITSIKSACVEYKPVTNICKEVLDNKSTVSSGHTNTPGFIEEDNPGQDADPGQEVDPQQEEQEMKEIVPTLNLSPYPELPRPEVEVKISPRSTDDVPVLANITGGKYEGDWHNGEMHGNGSIVFADGSQYDGEWKHNRPQGKGTRTYASGEVYRGMWFDGRRQGIGEIIYPDKRKFTGQWLNDLRHGAGKLQHPERIIPGYWKHDVFVGDSITHFKNVEMEGYGIKRQPKLLIDIPETEYVPSIPPTLPDEEEMISGLNGLFTTTTPAVFINQTHAIDASHSLEPVLPDNESSCCNEVEVDVAFPSSSSLPGKKLNAWKVTFFETHGRHPTKKDINKNPDILLMYSEYESKEGRKEKKKKKKKKTRKRIGTKTPQSHPTVRETTDSESN